MGRLGTAEWIMSNFNVQNIDLLLQEILRFHDQCFLAFKAGR